jgi:CHAT domain-containing protein
MAEAMNHAVSACPDLEAIAAYLDGRVTAREGVRITEHLAACEDCYFVFTEAAQTRVAEASNPAAPAESIESWWTAPRIVWSSAGAAFAAAAAIILAVQVVIPNFERQRQDPIQTALLAFDDALGQLRPIAPRVAEGFGYKPLAFTRSGETSEASLELRESALAVEKAATAAGRKAEAQRALATMHLYLGRSDRAIEILERLAQNSRDAAVFTDLSAAYLTRHEPGDSAHALDIAEQAVRAAPDRAEAWFNVALAAEALGLSTRAREAWSRYLALDPSSGWSREATQHLQQLKPSARLKQWELTKPQFEQALAAGDRTRTASIVSSFADETRVYFDRELLPAWADAHVGRRATASTLLARATLAAQAQTDATGDRMQLDVVDAIHRAADARSPELADMAIGVQELRRGTEIYEDVRWTEAAPRFAEALKRLTAANQPLAAWAAFYSTLDDYYQSRLTEASLKLEALRRQADARRYAFLEARCLWMLGLVHSSLAEIATSTDEYVAAIESFERLTQLESVSAVSALAATNFDYLGDLSAGWSYRQRALVLSNELGNYRSRHTILRSAVRAALEQALNQAALQFENAALENAEHWGAAGAIAEAYVGRAAIHAEIGESALAREDLRGAREWLSKVPDLLVRQRMSMELPAVEAAVALRDKPSEAIESLSRALGAFEWSGNRKALLYRERGRAHLAVSQVDLAEADYQSSIHLLEQQRAPLSDRLRISFFDRTSDVYGDMIGLQTHERHKTDAALEYAERGRARALLDAVEGGGTPLVRNPLDLRLLLPARTAVLYFAVLDGVVLSWLIAPQRVVFVERRISRSELSSLIVSFRQAIGQTATFEDARTQSAWLYDLLISPHEASLPSQTTLIIVPDGSLHELPFAALFNPRTRRFLVQDHAIAVAPSATMLERMSTQLTRRAAGPATRALVIGNPESRQSKGQPLPSLPDAQAEARAIATMYDHVDLVTGSMATKHQLLTAAVDADVVHFAGHAIANPQHPLLSRLLLTPVAGDDDGNLFAYELESANLPRTRLVVLAACSTARGPIRRGEGVVSLARSFLATGIPSVVASLWDIDDRRSRELFETFYMALQQGKGPVDALRDAQLKLLTADPRAIATWASVVIVSGTALSRRSS